MSVLNDDYHHLAETIYGALGESSKSTHAHQALYEIVKKDVNFLENISPELLFSNAKVEPIFHEKQSLTSEELQDEEINLGNTADREDRYADDKVDFDDESPCEIAYRNIAYKYPGVSLVPRGERVALYEALENYCISWQKSATPADAKATLKNILLFLTDIRHTAMKKYEDKLGAFGSEENSAEADNQANKYIVGALNAQNMSQDGDTETIKDLLYRVFTKEMFEDTVKDFHTRTNSDHKFLAEMKSMHEIRVARTAARAAGR